VWCVTLLFALAVPAAVLAQSITVLHVNDTHSHLDSFGPRDAQLDGTLGGLTRAAAVIKKAQDESPNTLLLHAGDLFVGDLFFNKYFGVPELQLLRGLGLEAMTVGNHEFDLGPDLLATAAQAAGLPAGFFLSANADTSGCDGQPCAPLRELVEPSRIVTVDGVQIGIFGMTTPDDPTMNPTPVKILGKASPGTVIGTALATAVALREQGAQVVILLSHLGLAYDKAIAGSQPTHLIDFVVGGHDHEVLTTPIELSGTRIVSAGEFYGHVGQLRFTWDGSTVHFDDYALLPVGSDVVADPATKAVVDMLEQGIVQTYGDVYDTVIGNAPWNLERHYDPLRPARDTPLGNLVTDAYRFKTGTEIGLAASGYIAERIWKGPIVPADVFRTVSCGYNPATKLDFPLVKIGLKGSELMKGMEIALTYLGVTDAFFLQFSGVRYQYDSRSPKMQRIVPGSVHVGGNLIEPERVYSVTVNYAVAAIAQQAMHLQLESWELAGMDEYVAVRDYVQRLKNVTGHSQGRIKDMAVADEP
ncbi:MAG: bifunctional metallophosphatase/5'-nucleotidase, partial [Actinobacteria bacterium]